MSVQAAIAMSLMCGVIVVAIAHDRGRGLWEMLLLLTRLDKIVISALLGL